MLKRIKFLSIRGHNEIGPKAHGTEFLRDYEPLRQNALQLKALNPEGFQSLEQSVPRAFPPMILIPETFL